MTATWQPIASQLGVAFLEALVLVSLLLLLFRLRSRLGMALIYVMVGVLQPVQSLLAASVYFEPISGIPISPGSMVFFPIGLVAILLVYIREDAREASKLVYGLVAANLFSALLFGLAAQHLILEGSSSFLAVPAELLTVEGRVLAAGTIVLLLDALLVILTYEALGRWLTRLLPVRLIATLAVVLAFDSLAFATIAFSGSELFLPVLAGGGVGKLTMAVFYGLALFLYLRFVEPRESGVDDETPFADIFYALTYRQKYEVERQCSERALREAGERVNAILQATIEAILLIDEEGRITDHNVAARRVFDADDSFLAERTIGELLQPDDRVRFAEHLARVRARSEESTGSILELEARRPTDGGSVPVELTVAPVVVDGDDRFVVSLRDVTEQKRLRDDLLRAQMLESIGRLAGGIAHDFNNVLTAIYGHAQLARVGLAENSPLEVHLGGIEEATQRAADLTQQLLAFARRKPSEPSVIDVNGSVRSTESLLRRLIGDDVVMVTRLGQALYPVKIDPLSIDQILINLAVNARDAMAGGGSLTIETANATIHGDEVPELTPGDYVSIAVTDSGSGMTPEVLEHLFEPFFTTKEASGGTGLGLSTCFGIVKQNGGHIAAVSQLGEGSTMTVLLPRSHETPAELTERGRTTSRRGHERILFVEDHSEVRNATAEALRQLGYQVRTAGSGAQALGLVEDEDEPFDLLVTDIVMPGMRGTDLSRILRRQFPKLRVLLVTSHVDDDVRRYLHQPNVSLLNKPFRPDQLSVVVREILGETSPGDSSIQVEPDNGPPAPN